MFYSQPSFKANEKTLDEMESCYSLMMRNNDDPRILFVIDDKDVVITAFNSKKVVFQGKKSEEYFAYWNDRNNYYNSNFNDKYFLGY